MGSPCEYSLALENRIAISITDNLNLIPDGMPYFRITTSSYQLSPSLVSISRANQKFAREKNEYRGIVERWT